MKQRFICEDKPLDVRVRYACIPCQGTGDIREMEECPLCKGKGFVKAWISFSQLVSWVIEP